jgi:hypothetical protein
MPERRGRFSSRRSGVLRLSRASRLAQASVFSSANDGSRTRLRRGNVTKIVLAGSLPHPGRWSFVISMDDGGISVDPRLRGNWGQVVVWRLFSTPPEDRIRAVPCQGKDREFEARLRSEASRTSWEFGLALSQRAVRAVALVPKLLIHNDVPVPHRKKDPGRCFLISTPQMVGGWRHERGPPADLCQPRVGCVRGDRSTSLGVDRRTSETTSSNLDPGRA